MSSRFDAWEGAMVTDAAALDASLADRPGLETSLSDAPIADRRLDSLPDRRVDAPIDAELPLPELFIEAENPDRRVRRERALH
ncbi:MAG: hypothetical protein AAGF12_41140 [Myxococcota bacterium]